MIIDNLKLHITCIQIHIWNNLKEFARKYKKAYYSSFML
ncbi:unnamed protein product [Ectocarpus sp. 12 AP-2014]